MVAILQLLILALLCPSLEAEQCDSGTCNSDLDDAGLDGAISFMQLDHATVKAHSLGSKLDHATVKAHSFGTKLDHATVKARSSGTSGNCPAGFYSSGQGWWSNAGTWTSVSHKGQQDIYQCSARCKDGCVAFSLYNFEECWTYTATDQFVGNDPNSGKSVACTKAYRSSYDCPSGYSFEGKGWWQNAGQWGSTSAIKASNTDIYDCAAKCRGGCVAFSLYDSDQCWTYTQISGSVNTWDSNSYRSVACQKTGSDR